MRRPAVRCWVVQVTAPGCEWLRVFDRGAPAIDAEVTARRNYGDRYVVAWEM